MNSTAYSESTTKKSISGLLAKVAILLAISLGLLWFSMNFPFYRVFEPQSLGWTLWVSYAKDLIQPFAFYFFICIGERWLKTWQVRAMIAFAVPTGLEIGQFFYYRVSPTHYVGSFDPMDIVMYAIGVGSAVITEQLLLAKLFKSYFI